MGLRDDCNKTINLDGTCPHADNGTCIVGRAGTPIGWFGRVSGMRRPVRAVLPQKVVFHGIHRHHKNERRIYVRPACRKKANKPHE